MARHQPPDHSDHQFHDHNVRMSEFLRGVGQGIAILVVFGVLTYFIATSVRMERFMVGARCTEMRCDAIERQLSNLPPKWLKNNIESIQLEQRRLQRQIDRIESAIPGIHGLPLEPYAD